MKKETVTNEKKYHQAKLKTTLWYAILIFGAATIILSIISLVFKISPFYALICFIVELALTRWRGLLIEDHKEKKS